MNWLSEWKLILLGIAGLFIGIQHLEIQHWKKLYQHEVELRKEDLANYKSAQAKAQTLAWSEKVRVEFAQNNLRKEADEKLEMAKIVSDRRLADYVRMRRPKPTASSNLGSTNLPDDAGVSEVDNGTSGTALVDAEDLRVCQRNTDRLLNAQEWWRGLSVIPVNNEINNPVDKKD